MINDNTIIEKLININKNNSPKINNHAYKRLSQKELEYIKHRYSDSDSDNETIKRIYFNIEEKTKCPICGKPVKWLGKTNRLMLNTCSLECGYVLRTQHIKETCLEKYGVTNCFASEEIKSKIKETCLEKYGVENPHQHIDIIEKTRKTSLERYGLPNGGGTEESIAKAKQTKLERYGDEKYVNLEKAKQTKIKNHTLMQSKLENFVYNLLKKKFSKIICQHSDKDLYPYNCDFYIPEIDAWIEIQGFVTHGNEPFDENNTEHLEKIVILKQKDKNHKNPGNNLYYHIINTWTKYDVEKRNIAKKNNLNYYEFWNIEQVENWLKTYEKKNN